MSSALRVLLCLHTLCVVTIGGDSSSRIIDGYIAQVGQFPYVVSLNINPSGDSVKCTGSILTARWVLTAAHCFKVTQSSDIRVRAATLDKEHPDATTQERVSVRHVIKDSEGDSLFDSDLALVEVDGAFDFNEYVQPIILVRKPFPSRGLVDCTAVGYGRIDDEGLMKNAFLHYMEASVGGKDHCKRKGVYAMDEGSWLCLKPGSGVTCSGDSGGPLVCQGLLAGVLSGKRYPDRLPCSSRTAVTVYNFAGFYESWIREYVPDLPQSKLINGGSRLKSRHFRISRSVLSQTGIITDILIIYITPIACNLLK